MPKPGAEALTAELPRTVIAARSSAAIDVRELLAFREVAFFLAWRDIKVRYKQTVIGAAWVLIQPAVTMIVFSVFFGRLVGVPSDGVPYPLWSLAGVMVWQLFTQALTDTSGSLVGNQSLLTKVYFPRLLLPLSAVFSALIDFAVGGTLLIGLLAWYRVSVSANAVYVPVFAVMAVIIALGLGFWLSALNVKYRDVRYTIPFLVQLGLFISPITYPASVVPEPYRLAYGLNPMAGVVEGFRWALLGTPFPSQLLLVSIPATIVLLVAGLVYFKRCERTLADVI
jgi:lipopolysaccharide transport system permease protein